MKEKGLKRKLKKKHWKRGERGRKKRNAKK